MLPLLHGHHQIAFLGALDPCALIMLTLTQSGSHVHCEKRVVSGRASEGPLCLVMCSLSTDPVASHRICKFKEKFKCKAQMNFASHPHSQEE